MANPTLPDMPTERELLDILRHSLGLSRSAEAYRNHFVTGPGSNDHAICMRAVERGLMQRHAPTALTGGMDCFSVTEAGRQFVREHTPPPVKRTRSQRRYQAFLDADTGMRFIDWLRYERSPSHG